MHALTSLQWDDPPNAGFSTGELWIAVNRDLLVVDVAAQWLDLDSVFAHYRHLIALRHEVPAVGLDAFELLLADDEQVWACTRRHPDVEPQPPDRSGDVRGSLMADRCSREAGVGTSMSVPVVQATVLVHRMAARQHVP